MANGTFQKTVICGHIGSDPVLRTTPDGTAVLNLSVATTHAWTNKETGKRETRTEWHRCIAFRNIADVLTEHTRKGDKVYLEGRNKTSKWRDEKTQSDHYQTEVIIDSFEFMTTKNQEDAVPEEIELEEASLQ